MQQKNSTSLASSEHLDDPIAINQISVKPAGCQHKKPRPAAIWLQQPATRNQQIRKAHGLRPTALAALSAAATTGDETGLESEQARAGSQPWISWTDNALSGKGRSLGVKNNHGSGWERGARPARAASTAYD